MFSTTGDSERTEALFGAVFFETVPMPTGGVEATMGVHNPLIIGLIFLGILIFCLFVSFMTGRLARYKASVISEREGLNRGADARGEGLVRRHRAPEGARTV